MPKKLLKKIMPDTKKLKEHKHLKVFGALLHDSRLWHLQRLSTARAFSIGLFCAMLPIPFQMILAAFLAIVFRANLPLSAGLVWVTNPVTMPAIYYGAYKLGVIILQLHPKPFHFELSFQWLMTSLGEIWEPFLLGCVLFGIFFAIVGNIGIRVFWRIWVVKAWRARRRTSA